jgi:hypothetical protein
MLMHPTAIDFLARSNREELARDADRMRAALANEPAIRGAMRARIARWLLGAAIRLDGRLSSSAASAAGD